MRHGQSEELQLFERIVEGIICIIEVLLESILNVANARLS